MKFNLFLSIIAIVISGLLFYGLFEIEKGEVILPVIATLVSIPLLVFTLGVSYTDYPRSSVMAKVFSGTCWVIALIMNILFAIFAAPTVITIISNALLVAICLAVVYSILRAKQ